MNANTINIRKKKVASSQWPVVVGYVDRLHVGSGQCLGEVVYLRYTDDESMFDPQTSGVCSPWFAMQDLFLDLA